MQEGPPLGSSDNAAPQLRSAGKLYIARGLGVCGAELKHEGKRLQCGGMECDASSVSSRTLITTCR